uniref:Rubicon like autophagy enhancer n=1 Tax=Aotus nancymaae TaxID=37293 RepID=A0A2K5D2Z6_AOTNA
MVSNHYCVNLPLRETHTPGPSPLWLGDSLAETTLSEDTTDSTGSTSPHGSSEKRSSFSLSSTEGQVVPPGCSDQVSLLTSPRILDTSPYPEIDSDLFEPSHLTSSADEGAVQVSRTISLNSFSPEVFVLPVDVEKENSHFYVADMIISAMEKMKYNILSQQQTESWSKEEALGLLGSDQPDSEVTFDMNIKQESGSSISSYSGYEGCAVLQVSPVTEARTYHDVAKEICKCDVDEFVILELGEFNDITETCSCSCSFSKSVTYEPDFNSAELLAKELYRVFRKCWILSVVNSQLASSLTAAGSIVVNEERVRKDFESSMNIVQEIKFKSRIRGTEDWAPPRFQIIFNIHPPLKRDLVVAAQNFFCAGCGTPIEPALKAFEQVPGHLTDELHLFSLEDLVRIKKGLLTPLLKDILKASLAHVAGCELCQGKGFICEFCRNTTVIFPFQTETCRRCSVCRACFHKQCFRSSECPRCARITARRKLLESVPSAAT